MKLMHFFKFTCLALMLMLSSCEDEITFTCTDISYLGSFSQRSVRLLSQDEIQRAQREALGTKAVVTFYDNSMRLTLSNSNGRYDYILNKTGPDNYSMATDNERIEVTFDKTFEYINSFKMIYTKKEDNVLTQIYNEEHGRNSDIKAVMSFKRE